MEQGSKEESGETFEGGEDNVDDEEGCVEEGGDDARWVGGCD